MDKKDDPQAKILDAKMKDGRAFADHLIDSWDYPVEGVSGHAEHADFDFIDSVHQGRRPGEPPTQEPGAPVPGCPCANCTGVEPVADPPRRHPLDRLPVEDARHVPILELVDRLGLGPARRAGKEHLIRCFMHDDQRPSLSINAKSGLWYCPVCAIGGDGIEMWRRVRGLSFADAVKEVAA